MTDDKLILQLSGSNRVISTEVFLKHIATALRHLDLTNGQHVIEIARDGSITVDGMVAYVPKRVQVAKAGAA